jgi:hypothetical protein
MRASISHVMEKSARNSKCQGSRIAQKYFNIILCCVNNSRRKKFCKSCHLHLVGILEAQGDYEFYEKNWKCEYCHRVRAVGKYCKLHMCLKCNSKVQIDFLYSYFMFAKIHFKRYIEIYNLSNPKKWRGFLLSVN